MKAAVAPQRASEQGVIEGNYCEAEGAARVRVPLPAARIKREKQKDRPLARGAARHARVGRKSAPATLRPPGRKFLNCGICVCETQVKEIF
ncbi:MAG TPA: hypothetical protein VD835_19475 [Pyrinomonadaceae bacterium]|nr:hypothetical protein [Pyrinomonadaceae bacterium]